MEELQEKILHRETATIEVENNRTPFSDLDEEVKLALHCASDKKASHLVVIDLREIASFTEFFVVASGNNQRQVQAIADEINERLKKELNIKTVRTEGYTTGEWILLDYGDFIVHVFEKNAREFYDLERLWLDAKRVDLPSEL